MNAAPWRQRLDTEAELQQQLRALAHESAARRAGALREGVTELGTIAAVARALGRSETAIQNAIRRHPATPPPATATTTA